MTTIKTLAEILADMEEPISADSSMPPSHKGTQQNQSSDNRTQTSATANIHTQSQPNNKPKRAVRQHKPSHQSVDTTTSIAQLLNDKQQSIIDDKTLSTLQNVTIEPVYQNDRTINRLRWLAFYYLSHRELSKKQLEKKLLAKDCEPKMVADLLEEFANKGYQSDERCAHMLIREGVRQGRGKRHIAQSLKNAELNLPYSLDELIDMAGIESLSDGTILDSDDDKQINWLKLAVEARCKKYGNHLPKDQKEKARQLRFLQYRGFEMSVCFDALKYTLDDMDELDFV